MKPPRFRYTASRSLEETLHLLAADGPEAKILAGGQSLVPLLNFRLARPAHLVDVNRLADLAYIRRDDGSLAIGALTRQSAVLASGLVREHCPLLATATEFVGHPPIRNRGTVGGSVAHADPAAELPLVFLALDARFRLTSVRGARAVAAADFFTGVLSTALAADELLTEIDVPLPGGGSGWGFHEVARRRGDFALAAAVALVTLDLDHRVAHVALAFGGVADRPVRAARAEQRLLGHPATPEALAEAARLAAEVLDPPADVHAGSDYRRHLARVLGRRALEDACRRAMRASGGTVASDLAGGRRP